MKKFLEWLVESNQNIEIDYSNIEKEFNAYLIKLKNSIEYRRQKISNFDPKNFLEKIQKELSDYPLVKNFIKSLESKNNNYIMDQYGKLRKWIDQKPFSESKKIRYVTNEIWTYLDYFDTDNFTSSEKDLENNVNQAMEGTKKNFSNLKSIIQNAISRIQNWNNSKVTISPMASENEFGTLLIPAKNAQIRLDDSASFTLFSDIDKFEIDDVMEGGEDWNDINSDSKVQSDYYNLINELRKPGSTSKDLILTLYSARPKEDRTQYLNSNKLPLNIFLTNNLRDAEGIAADLPSKSGARDIWKIKTNKKYLTQTLDGPIKHYQVTVADAPAKIELLSFD